VIGDGEMGETAVSQDHATQGTGMGSKGVAVLVGWARNGNQGAGWCGLEDLP